MKRSPVAAVLLWAALVGSLAVACKDEQPSTGGSEPASAVDRSALCSGGGATLNAQTNECVCPPSEVWNGLRCDAAPATATASATATQADAQPPTDHADAAAAAGAGASDAAAAASEPAAPAAEAAEPAAPAPPAVELPTPPGSSTDKTLAAFCRRAKGHWDAKDGYCLCPAGSVLVGMRCRALPGVITEEACRHSLHRGRWKNWHCDCDDGLVFAPSRGGCVAPLKDAPVALRRECESTLNRGKWDAANGICRCQEGRVWRDERCQPRRELSSRAICESGEDGGKWDDARKACRCPEGRVWLDQSCRVVGRVEPKAVCESEAGGGGKWNEKFQKCICPGLLHWDDTAKQCVR